MARFFAYRLADGDHVLDCQTDILSHLTTRFVVPLVPLERVGTPMAVLNPMFEIGGERLVMMTQFASAVPARSLGRQVAAFHDDQYAIMRALDMLLTGN